MDDPNIKRFNDSKISKVNVLGVGISAMTMEFALKQISNSIDDDDKRYISVCTVHTIMECQKDPEMRNAVNNAYLATPDGMPLVWLAGWQSDKPVERVYGPDLMLATCERTVESGCRHFFYGGAEGVAELLARNLSDRFPGLAVAGTFSPPFRSLTVEEESQVVELINQADPDIIWVGLGTPKQDLWMAKYRPRLNAPVIIAVGAAFDFHTGRIPQAPAWMQQSGLEWLFRLFQEPKRLWQRYLVYNPLFIIKMIEQKLGLRKYSLDS